MIENSPLISASGPGLRRQLPYTLARSVSEGFVSWTADYRFSLAHASG